MHWVLCSDGDEASHDIRARLVACGVAKDKQASCVASTPPLEAKRLLFDRDSNERTRGKGPLEMFFVHIEKAYFSGWDQRDVYMSPPKELGLPAELLCKQIRCVYRESEMPV